MIKTRRICLDNASTTPVARDAEKAMQPFLSRKFGNPSSLHKEGREAKEALKKARETIKKSLNATEEHKIIFTSGGTEANNLALKGIAFANKHKGNHIITSQIEHESVLKACEWLEKQGIKITYLPVDKEGIISLTDLKKNITKTTILVSIIHANNEIGTLQNIEEIGKTCKEKKVPFHTDACQSFTKVPINLQQQKIDLLTINAHKIHGPKGVGALVIRRGIAIDPLLHGGGHEQGLRSGTENVAGAIGFSKAIEIAEQKKEKINKMTSLRNKLQEELLKIEGTWLNGPAEEQKLCNITNISFKNIEGESIVLHLDAKGIAASTGSACSSSTLKPSHVLTAIGLKPEESHGSVRFSLSRENTIEEIEYTIKSLREIVETLRKISPFKFKS